jgi:hypothetical protein
MNFDFEKQMIPNVEFDESNSTWFPLYSITLDNGLIHTMGKDEFISFIDETPELYFISTLLRHPEYTMGKYILACCHFVIHDKSKLMEFKLRYHDVIKMISYVNQNGKWELLYVASWDR